VILGSLPVALGSSIYAYRRASDRAFAIAALALTTLLLLFHLVLIGLVMARVLT